MFTNITFGDETRAKRNQKASATRERLVIAGQPVVSNRPSKGLGAMLARMGQRLQKNTENKRK
jgi:nucleoid DNA-binding protein